MIRLPKLVWMAALVANFVAAGAANCSAGPWGLFGRNQPVYPVGTPVPVAGQTAYSPAIGVMPPSYAAYAGSQISANSIAFPPPAYWGVQTAGYGNYAAAKPPTTNAPLLAPGFPQTVAGYLPTAAYDTQWNRVPVTYYRPVTAFDPRYGTTVTSLQPCTSYQYQAQRSPVIAPRPLLGEYGLQANKWPSITGPGYNPTGLVVSNMPVASPYQAIPNSGMPYLGQPTYAPMATSGTSFGMPTTNLPATTMSTPSMSTPSMTFAQPFAGYQSGYATIPSYSSPLPSDYYRSNGIANNTTPYYTTQPAITNPNGTCANGSCNPAMGASANVPLPSIPGASSVVPYGPPTYSPVPSSTNPGAAPGNPGNQYAPNPILPNAQVLPNTMQPNTGAAPGSANSNLIDPESVRQPALRNFGSTVPAPSPALNTLDVRNQPMVAIDRGLAQGNLIPSLSDSASMDAMAKGLSQSKSIDSSISLPSTPSARIPDTLPREYSNVKPLTAPQDFDSRPRWNPTLLNPDDRTAMEREESTSRPSLMHEAVSKRIRLLQVEMPTANAVAFQPVLDRNKDVQLASGIETKKPSISPISQPIQPGFRPVTKLK